MMLLMLVMAFAGAQRAGATVNLTPHITYGDGLSSSNVTIKATTKVKDKTWIGFKENETQTLTNNKTATFRKTHYDNVKIHIAVTSSENIIVTYSGVKGLSQSGTGSSFSVSDGNSYNINITVRIVTNNSYTIHFDKNASDATGTMDDQAFTDGQSQALTANGFIREGYTFAGWNTKADGSGTSYKNCQSVSNLTTTADATITLYAQWKECDITITQNGSVNMPLKGTTTVTIPNGVTMFKVYDDGGPSGDYSAGCDGYLLLTAPDGHYLQVTGTADTNSGGAGRNALTVYDGSTTGDAKLLNEFRSRKHVGSGVLNNFGTISSTGRQMLIYFHTYKGDNTMGTLPDKGLDLTVRVIELANTYTVHFDANGGTGTMTDQAIEIGVATNLKKNAFKHGNDIFLDWNTKADGTGTAYANMTSVINLAARGENITLYAQWTAVLTIQFDNNADDATGTMDDQIISSIHQDIYLKANAYSRTGYTFAGWSATPDGNVLYADRATIRNHEGTLGKTLTLYAQWIPDLAVNGDGTYTINSIAGWDAFCDRLAGGTSFTGKTVKLAKDISVSRMAGSSSSPFTGTFDGQGKTLTVSYENTGNNTMTAPFSYVDGATIQNLVVDGSITGSAYRAAGLIGETGTTTSYITNCVSKLSISGDRYTGGFSIGGNVEIEGCVFCGTINGSSRSGGFVGFSHSALKITNCLFAPKSGSSISGGTFYYKGDADITPSNSYYTTALGDAQGTKTYALSAAPANLGSAVTGVSYTVLTAYGNGILFGGKYYVAPEAVTIADNAMNDLSGKNGYVADVTLQGRTLYRDGAWNTLCLPFAVSNFTGTPLEGATVKELLTTSNLDNGTLTLNFSSSNVTVIEAGKPYIVKWTTTGSNIVSPVFTDVIIDGTSRDVNFTGGTFKGNYSPLEITDANRDDIVLLAAGNKLGYAKTDRTLGACHAYFEIPGSAQARRFVLNLGDGETTGLRPLSGSPEGEGFDGVWHDLQGRRIGNGQKPSAKGMYIVNGKVAVVK